MSFRVIIGGIKIQELKYRNRLKCKECGREFPPIKLYACEFCFGPLEVTYDLESFELNRESFINRPKTVWRYHDLLPVSNIEKIVDLGAGYTPLHKCDRLADTLGLKTLFVKDDTVNPTGSFKDRPATVAVTKALEFGANAVGCASTGNLAAAVAAHAAKAGVPCYVFIPSDIEANKVLQAATFGAKIISVKGTYDEVNRLATQASEIFNWALANIDTRPYYVEGSKTLGYEICEQLGWRAPDHIIVPTASGALLCAIDRGLNEFQKLDLINHKKTRMTAAQPLGCSPIADAFKSNAAEIKPIEYPDTIAKSLAIGDPADGIYALKAIRNSGGEADSASNQEILEAIQILGKNEGIFAEPAGGVTIAILKKLIDSGAITSDEEVVCCVTGSGFKATETILKSIPHPIEIEPTLKALKKKLKKK